MNRIAVGPSPVTLDFQAYRMESNDIPRVIEEALKRKGTNPTRVARDNGWSVNAIRYILEGRPPSARRLSEVCQALDLEFYVGPPRSPHGARLDIQELARELERLASEARRIDAESRRKPLQIDQATPYVSAPRYEVLAAAGAGSPVDAETVRGYLGFNRAWLRDQQLTPEHLAVIEVQGDSMEPTLQSGDVVLLDMRPQQPRDGVIYTLRRDSDLMVKRLRRKGLEWFIHSDNRAYQPERLGSDSIIVGRVVWLGRTL